MIEVRRAWAVIDPLAYPNQKTAKESMQYQVSWIFHYQQMSAL